VTVKNPIHIELLPKRYEPIELWSVASTFEAEAGHKNMLYLIQLRWIAVLGQITTIAIVSLPSIFSATCAGTSASA